MFSILEKLSNLLLVLAVINIFCIVKVASEIGFGISFYDPPYFEWEGLWLILCLGILPIVEIGIAVVLRKLAVDLNSQYISLATKMDELETTIVKNEKSK